MTPFGSFEEWARVMGGILAYAGIDGFLANRNAVQDRGEEEAEHFATILTALKKVARTEPFTVGDLMERDDAPMWANILPAKMHRDGNVDLARSLGRFFAQLEGRALTHDGLRIVRLAEKKHNATVWQIVGDSDEKSKQGS
jgi:hypothetical protein